VNVNSVDFGGSDSLLPVQKGATSARVALPSGNRWDILPVTIKDAESGKTADVIGIYPIEPPKGNLTIEQVEQNIREDFVIDVHQSWLRLRPAC
jgi:hypothetical protein